MHRINVDGQYDDHERRSGLVRVLVDGAEVGDFVNGPWELAEAAEWVAILRSCSAYEPFFKRTDRPLTGRAVAEFLLLDPAFPRSVRHCLERAWNFVQLIAGTRVADLGRESAQRLITLLTRLRAADMDAILERGMHEELTDIIDELAATFERDPALYYEDGYQEYADRGGVVGIAPIGSVDWVEVDNHDDLARAREIRCHF
jgi:hypothetical protein